MIIQFQINFAGFVNLAASLALQNSIAGHGTGSLGLNSDALPVMILIGSRNSDVVIALVAGAAVLFGSPAINAALRSLLQMLLDEFVRNHRNGARFLGSSATFGLALLNHFAFLGASSRSAYFGIAPSMILLSNGLGFSVVRQIAAVSLANAGHFALSNASRRFYSPLAKVMNVRSSSFSTTRQTGDRNRDQQSRDHEYAKKFLHVRCSSR